MRAKKIRLDKSGKNVEYWEELGSAKATSLSVEFLSTVVGGQKKDDSFYDSCKKRFVYGKRLKSNNPLFEDKACN